MPDEVNRHDETAGQTGPNTRHADVDYAWSHQPRAESWIVENVLKKENRRNVWIVAMVTPFLTLLVLYPQWLQGKLRLHHWIIALVLMEAVSLLGMLLQMAIAMWGYRKHGASYRLTSRGVYRQWAGARTLIPWKSIAYYGVDPVGGLDGLYRISLFLKHRRHPVSLYVDDSQLSSALRIFAMRKLAEGTRKRS